MQRRSTKLQIYFSTLCQIRQRFFFYGQPAYPGAEEQVIATLRLSSRWKSFAVQENWLDIAWAAAHQHDKEERHILQNAGNFFHALQCEFRAFQRRC